MRHKLKQAWQKPTSRRATEEVGRSGITSNPQRAANKTGSSGGVSPRSERGCRSRPVLGGRLHAQTGAYRVGPRARGAAAPHGTPRPTALAVGGGPPEGEAVCCLRKVRESRLFFFFGNGWSIYT